MRKSLSNEAVRRYTRANRAAWDEAAPIHKSLNHARLLEAFSNPGHSTLDEHCRAPLVELGIAGKSVAQVCCNNGRELLSLRNLGAGRCVGFDASAPFIEQARELAAAAGHDDVEFVVTDAYDIPDCHSGEFELVVTTIGVLGWMPDLPRFFDILAGLTAPGGHLFIEETHPVLQMYEEAEDGGPSYLAYSYFKKEPWRDTKGLDYYTGKRYESNPNYSFQHTLADIMTAAIGVRLVLRQFSEFGYDISRLCADLEHAVANPPMGMTMIWQKTDG